MTPAAKSSPVLHTTAGDFRLGECRLAVGNREWSVVSTSSVVTRDDEARYLANQADQLPYGVALWPASIALAHEIATRAEEFRARRVLELGAGTGLPGIVAASFGAMVIQTDRNELALHLCRLNGERNQTTGVEYRLADWTAWDDRGRYDWVIGSDILYADSHHSHLRRILDSNVAAGGRVLLADPFRQDSLPFLEGLETSGWQVTHSRWVIGEGSDARPVAVHELRPPS